MDDRRVAPVPYGLPVATEHASCCAIFQASRELCVLMIPFLVFQVVRLFLTDVSSSSHVREKNRLRLLLRELIRHRQVHVRVCASMSFRVFECFI